MSLQRIGLIVLAVGFGIALTVSYLLPVNIFPLVTEAITSNPNEVLGNGELTVTTQQVLAASWEQHPMVHIGIFSCLVIGLLLMTVGAFKRE